MATFIDELLGKNLNFILIKYSTDSGSKSSYSFFYDAELAHNKRVKADELIKSIREFRLYTLGKGENSFNRYKRDINLIIDRNQEAVEAICSEKKADFGFYSHFLDTVRYSINAFLNLCIDYEINYCDLNADLTSDMKLAFFKTLMDYELETAINKKYYAQSATQKVVNLLSNPEKHEEKVSAMRKIAKDLEKAITNIQDKDSYHINNLILTFVESAMTKEQEIQKGMIGSSTTGSQLTQLANLAFGSITSIAQKSMDYLRTTKLNEKLSKFKQELITYNQPKNYQSM